MIATDIIPVEEGKKEEVFPKILFLYMDYSKIPQEQIGDGSVWQGRVQRDPLTRKEEIFNCCFNPLDRENESVKEMEEFLNKKGVVSNPTSNEGKYFFDIEKNDKGEVKIKAVQIEA